MLTRLKLHRFRYIKPGTELMFTERFNVLLGKNGTGKTTLLQLISMVLRSDFSTLREEEFDIEYEYRHEHGNVLVRIENKLRRNLQAGRNGGGGKPRPYQPHVLVKVHVDEPESNYEIEVHGAAMHWRRDGGPWTDNIIINVFAASLLDILGWATQPTDPHSHQPGSAFSILTELASRGECSYRFDESLGIFESITSGVVALGPNPDHPFGIWLEIQFDSGARTAFFVAPAYAPTRPEPGQSSTSVEVPATASLAKFSDLAGIKGMSMSLAVEGNRQEDGELWWHLSNAEFLFSTAKSSFNHNALSYGQKRLLAFLYYLDTNPQYVVADELVNGMHHEWLRACFAEIGNRQAFLTSQNPLLLDYLPLESVEQAQKTFIQCRTEVVDDEPQIIWSNLAAEDAAELFADYQVGIQHVGEILRARGLW